MKKALGITTLVSVIALVVVLYLTYAGEAEVSSIYIQSSMFLLVTTLALVGVYSVEVFCAEVNALAKKSIWGIGTVLILLSALVSFNIIDFISSVNWMISLGIIFMMLVQLQLLGWGNKTGSIAKISSFLLIASNAFLAVFFITKMDYTELEIWIHASVLCSLISFVVGMLFVPRTKKASEA